MRRIIMCLLALAIFSGLASANSIKLIGGQAIIYDDSNKIISQFGNLDIQYFSHYIVINNVAFVGGDGGLYSLDMNTGAVLQEWPGGGSAGQVTALAYSSSKNLLAVGYEDVIDLMDVSNVRNVNSVNYIFTTYMPDELSFKGSTLYTDVYKYDCSNVKQPRCVNPGAQVFIYDNKGTWATETITTKTYDVPVVIGFGWKGTEPIVGDWNGDGFKEVGIYNRAGSNFLIPSFNERGYEIIGLGWAGVTPLCGDFDGDGDDDVGVYDNKGTWALNTNSGVKIVGFGWTGTEPVIGDWNGDGIDEVGIYNRAGNNWMLRLSQTKADVIGLGWAGVKTLVGNFDSDKSDEVCVYDPTTSTFVASSGYQKVFGKKSSQPILGDPDCNGIVNVGVIYTDGTIHYNIAEYLEATLVQWKSTTAIGT